jgi:hypothetical protein
MLIAGRHPQSVVIQELALDIQIVKVDAVLRESYLRGS